MKKGDHLVVSRLGYSHHGLYVGGGMVIHYSGFVQGISGGVIETISLDSFCDGEQVAVRDYWERKYSRKKSVKRAYSRLGEDSYNVLFNNCEHFVTWCITGSHSSRQVQAMAGLAMGSMPAVDMLLKTAPSLICDQTGPTGARLAGKLLSKTATVSLAKSLTPAATGSAGGLAANALATASLATVSSSSSLGMVAFGSAASALSPVVLPAAVGVAGVYCVKKLFDCIWD